MPEPNCDSADPWAFDDWALIVGPHVRAPEVALRSVG